MLDQKLETICKYYLREFKRVKKDISISELKSIARKEAKKAKDNYSKIKTPKTCKLKTYISIWVREYFERKLETETLEKIETKKSLQDPFAQKLDKFSKTLPIELIPIIKNKIFSAEITERKRIWKNLNLPIKKIERNFQELLIARKEKLSRKNQMPFLQIFLHKNKIPTKDCQEFYKNVNSLIKQIQKDLPKLKDTPKWFYSEFNLPCFVCQLENYLFNSQEEVFATLSKEYPILKKFESKIIIKNNNNQTNHTIYNKNTDTIEINIAEKNTRHYTLVLIHELGHVISLINNLKKGKDLIFEKGKYGSEKNAIKIQLNFLKETSEDLYKAFLGEILITIWKTIFEIKINENPKQDISKLYAETFKLCFPKAKQKTNPLYILEEDFITSPFRKLPHTIAFYKILKDTYSQ